MRRKIPGLNIEEYKEKIIEDYKNGKGINDLAKEYKVSNGNMWNYINKWGILVRKIKPFKGEISDYTNEVIKLFDEGISIHQISKKLHISDHPLIDILKKNGRDTSRGCTRDENNLLKNKLDLVIEMYNKGLDGKQIEKELGYASTSIIRLLNNQKVRTKRDMYEVNNHFFDNIDTEYKAYIFGFGLADGCISRDGAFTISLQHRDREILEKMKNIMEYTGPIHFQKSKNPKHQDKSILAICRKELTQQLIEKGCIHAKTMILTFPTSDIIPDHLLHFMLLGYLDGDGSITKKYVNIVGNLFFITSLSKKLNELEIFHKIYQRYKSRKPEDSSQQLFIHRKDDKIKFIKWLYKDATLFLQRKAQKALEIVPDLNITLDK